MRTSQTCCLRCGASINAAELLEDPTCTPEKDDLTMCLYCDHFMAFNADLTVRELTNTEAIELAQEPEVIEHMRAFGEEFRERTPRVN